MRATGIRQLPPEEWLEDLVSLFPSPGFASARFRVVAARDVPSPFHQLLVHQHHMTVTLEEQYRVPVGLEVLDVYHIGNEYARKLRLTAGANGPVVLGGIMRFFLNCTSAAVREEILHANRPLGRILIEHDVLRRIETLHFVRVEAHADLAKLLEVDEGQVVFGRLAVLFCDESPAVELLEIVAPAEERAYKVEAKGP